MLVILYSLETYCKIHSNRAIKRTVIFFLQTSLESANSSETSKSPNLRWFSQLETSFILHLRGFPASHFRLPEGAANRQWPACQPGPKRPNHLHRSAPRHRMMFLSGQEMGFIGSPKHRFETSFTREWVETLRIAISQLVLVHDFGCRQWLKQRTWSNIGSCPETGGTLRSGLIVIGNSVLSNPHSYRICSRKCQLAIQLCVSSLWLKRLTCQTLPNPWQIGEPGTLHLGACLKDTTFAMPNWKWSSNIQKGITTRTTILVIFKSEHIVADVLNGRLKNMSFCHPPVYQPS